MVYNKICHVYNTQRPMKNSRNLPNSNHRIILGFPFAKRAAPAATPAL